MSNQEINKGAVGWITFAGFMLVISGGFSMLEGLGMVIHASNFPGKDAIFQQNGKTWGWYYIILGIVLLLSGFGVFSGNVLARTVGVIAATVAALGAFATVQLQPVWNIAVIAVSIAVIWALTAHGRDIKKLDELDA